MLAHTFKWTCGWTCGHTAQKIHRLFARPPAHGALVHLCAHVPIHLRTCSLIRSFWVSSSFGKVRSFSIYEFLDLDKFSILYWEPLYAGPVLSWFHLHFPRLHLRKFHQIRKVSPNLSFLGRPSYIFCARGVDSCDLSIHLQIQSHPHIHLYPPYISLYFLDRPLGYRTGHLVISPPFWPRVPNP